MKTKITSKNKNVINIKINTEKKAKNKGRRRGKQSSPKGRSSYNSGYSVTPPIIINPFPKYQQPQQINNTTREPQPIQQPMQYIAQEPQPLQAIAPEPQPVRQKAPQSQPVCVFKEPVQPFINPTTTTPATIMQSYKMPHNITKEKDDEFINTPSTRQVSFAKSLNAEKALNAEKDSHGGYNSTTTNIESTPKMYSDFETDDEEKAVMKMNTPESIGEFMKIKKKPVPDDMEKNRKKEQSNVVNALYHSLTGDFDKNNDEDIKNVMHY